MNARTLIKLFLVCVTVVLAACSETRIRDNAQSAYLDGNYEAAIQALEDGLKQYPHSTLIKSRLIQVRADSLAQTIAKSAALKATGRLDEAEKALRRAAAIDPSNPRIEMLLNDVQAERRQNAALDEATALYVSKSFDSALQVIAQALKDNPRHSGLRSLQRKIELEQKQALLKIEQQALRDSRLISLDFRDAPLKTVLDTVSRNSGVNFILDKDLRNDVRVTVYLKQAALTDALDLIISTNQLAKKVVDERTIVIYPNTADKQREYQEQIVRVFYLSSAEAQGASAFLKSMLKIRDPYVNERSNMLALRDSPENISLAARLLDLYDTGEPEVLLEVEVMEVSSNRLTELGIKYPDTFTLTPLAPNGSSGLTLANLEGLGRDRVGVNLSGLIINLKKQVGDATTLANPKIRARNKEKARVLIGDKIPVITTTTGNAGFVSDTVNYLDVGLKLDVEPTVYPDDDVAIKVALEVSSLGTAVKTASGTLAYQIGTRNASTLLRLKDGETQLLAGLISKDDRTATNKVPGLGDFPILGRLFGSQSDNSTRTELVLAITPRVLRNVKVPDASDSELWIGTESLPRLRAPGGYARTRFPATANDRVEDKTPQHPSSSDGSSSTATQIPQSPPTIKGSVTPVLSLVAPKEVEVGQAVDVQLRIDAESPIRGMPIQLDFDPEQWQIVDLYEGDFFRKDGVNTSFTKTIEPEKGIAAIGVLRSTDSPIGGKGVIFNVRLVAKKAGDSIVKVSRATSMGMAIPAPTEIALPTTTIKVK